MAMRQRLACNFSPLMLRVLLAIVFLWAGLGKVVEKDLPVTAENAQTLVDWGAISPDQVRHLLPGSAMASMPRLMLAQATDTNADPAVVVDATVTEVNVQRLYGIALMLKAAADPGVFPPEHTRAGESKMALAPEFAGKDKTPVYLAWAVALTEVFAGGFMLLGFLTRLSALSLVGVMLGAIWLTTIGPAMQEGTAALGFLPAYEPFAAEWIGPIFQLSMLVVSLAVVFSGPGAASLDRLLFGGGHTPSPSTEPKAD